MSLLPVYSAKVGPMIYLSADGSPVWGTAIEATHPCYQKKISTEAKVGDAAIETTHAYYQKKIAEAEAGRLSPEAVLMFAQLAAALGARPCAKPLQRRMASWRGVNPPRRYRRWTYWWAASALLAAASIVALAWPWPNAVLRFMEGILR